MSRRSWLLFCAMCVIWGIPYLLIRVAVRDYTPGALVFARTAIGGLILLPIALRQGGFGPVLSRWRPLVAFAVIELAIPWLLLSDAEKRLSSSLSGLLIAAVPLAGVATAWLAGDRDRVDLARGAGLVLGLVGVGMLVGLDVRQLSVRALVEIGVVVIGYASAPIILDRRLSDLPRVPVISAALLFTAVCYLPVAILQPPKHFTLEASASVLTLGLICTALAFVVFLPLIAAIGPARSVVITYVNPAVAVALGVLLLSEKFTVGMAIGFPMILIGSVLAARRRRPDPGSEAVPVRELPSESLSGAALCSVDADVTVRGAEPR
jgi:drug/metabolite transporter (DMT)-like permease